MRITFVATGPIIEGIPLAGQIRTSKGVTTFHPWAHAKDCTCTPEQTFTCTICGRRFGWCLGASDNMPEACDLCWHE